MIIFAKKMNATLAQLLLAMLLWGGAWAFAKYISHQADLLFLIAVRFMLSSAAVFVFIVLARYKLKTQPKAILLSFLAGIGLVLYNTTFFLGLRYGLASVGGVLVTTLNPIFTYFAISLYQRKRLPMRSYIGLLLGLVGGAIIMELWQKDMAALISSGNIFFLLCAGFWVMVTVTSKASEKYMSNPVFSFYTYIFVALFALIILLLFKPQSFSWAKTRALPWDFWAAMLYLSVLSVGFATSIYFLATRKLGAQVASSFIFTVPVGALIASWLLLGEVPRISTLAGGVLNLGAVYYLNWKK